MWCEKRPNGKVRFGERYEHPLTGQTKRVFVTMDRDTTSTRKQAKTALNNKIKELLGNITATVKKENLRFSELVQRRREIKKVGREIS